MYTNQAVKSSFSMTKKATVSTVLCWLVMAISTDYIGNKFGVVQVEQTPGKISAKILLLYSGEAQGRASHAMVLTS